MAAKTERDLTFERIDEDLKKGYSITEFDIENDRYVFFSDIHKGSGNKKSDAFVQNETTFCFALNKYFDDNFTLVQVGDIEECWGFKVKKALKRYKDTVFHYEGKFFNAKRYYRIFGNHDFKWRKPKKVDKLLKPLLSDKNIELKVWPALQLGEKMVAVHGHQGSFESDQFWKVSKGFVRFWTSIWFRTFGRKKYRASKNAQVRKKRDRYLREWSEKNNRLLIAGHTHGYLFESTSKIPSKIPDIEKLEKKLEKAAGKLEKLVLEEQIEKIKNLSKKYKDEIIGLKYTSHLKNVEIPRYFNIGAGVYTDGITCIEIDKGEIRLVMWVSSHFIHREVGKKLKPLIFVDKPQRVEIISEDLKEILKKI